MKKLIFCFMLICSICFVFSENTWSAGKDPDTNTRLIIKRSDGFVADENTALIIADAVLRSVYGDVIDNEKPFNIKLVENDTVWLISGTLPTGYLGGVAYIKISKETGEILGITHTK